MRHGIAHRKLNRTSEHLQAMFKNMICSLVKHEQISTTLPKAKELRPLAEKLISLGKRYKSCCESEKLHVRRLVLRKVGGDVEAADKVIGSLAERFSSRNGGFLRIVRNGFRYGDRAPMAIISMVGIDPAAEGDAATVADKGALSGEEAN
ncbi:MAG: 50S ribosomal protein L17 [Holosporales bacterium]|nr:50S ribosomal protein L17 [Holosporales bacterium]